MLMLPAGMKTWKVHGLADVEFLWYQDNIDYPDHVHQGYDIDYVESGLLEYNIAGRRFILPHSNFVWVRPHEVHSARSLSTHYVLRALLFSESYIKNLTSELEINNDRLVPSQPSDLRMRKQIVTLHKRSEKTPDPFEVETRLLEFLSLLLSSGSTISRVSDSHQAAHHIK